jgi:hypothetical protein
MTLLMRAVPAVAMAAVVLAGEARPSAWGLDVHRRLTERALDALPPPLGPFVAAKRDFIREHSVDPDLWRVVDLRGERGPEDANHFLDIDGLDEPPPFTNVPREWAAYVARYGAERANRMGRLPWRAEEIDGLLVKAFRSIGSSPYGADNARYLIAVLAHYLADAHQPFHAVMNYDGQLTNQRGIHARFETELVLRNWQSLELAPVRIRPVASVRDLVFSAVVEGAALVPDILAADRRALGGRDRTAPDAYGDAYYAALLAGTRPVLEARLSESASALASVVVSAWERAGRPNLTEVRRVSAGSKDPALRSTAR